MRFFNGKGQCILCLFDNISFRFSKGSTQRVYVISASDSQSRGPEFVPLWPLAGYFLGRPELKSSATLENSQLVATLPVGFLSLLFRIEFVCFIFPEKPRTGEDNNVFIIITSVPNR